MGLIRRHGFNLSFSIAFLFFFAMEIGFSFGGIIHEDKKSFLRWKKTEYDRRLLIGLGSTPPTCRWRCGHCFPCQPVHVAIEPGRSMPLDYYPEAWRCKCGNKLFMP